MSQQRIIVAIDGPAGAGKSTIAKSVAAKLGFVYIDTGAMYRAVALWAVRAGIAESDVHKIEQLALQADIAFEPGTQRVFLNGEDVTQAIREPEISVAASKVSAIAGVRRAMVEKQRDMAVKRKRCHGRPRYRLRRFPGCPGEDFSGCADVRSAWRVAVANCKGADDHVDPNGTARDIADRDQRDRSRAEAPLVQAPDACTSIPEASRRAGGRTSFEDRP